LAAQRTVQDVKADLLGEQITQKARLKRLGFLYNQKAIYPSADD
jgi:hypothetical protein